MSTKHKYLYIPVEVKVRELDGKMLLATAAAARGYRVIIARKAELMTLLPSLPPGIFLAAWAQEGFLESFKMLKNKGFVIAVMDEEGLATFSDTMYQRFKLSDATLSEVEMFLGWGQKQIETMQRLCKPQKPPRYYQTGNVRFDILKPTLRHLAQKQTKSITARYGRIILINSSFSLGNHYNNADDYFIELKKNKVIQSQDDWDFLHRYRLLQEKLVKAYVELVPAIAEAFPDHSIILRPHPSENHETWKKAAPNMPNVHVIHEGAVHPWLFASDAVVHHFCTTALEAYAANVPSIAYRAFQDAEIETTLPYLGSLEAKTQSEMLEALHDSIHKNAQKVLEKRSRNQKELAYYIANTQDNYAYHATIDAFDNHAISTNKNASTSFTFGRKVISYLKKLKAFLTGKEKNYVTHKCASIEKAELQALIDTITKTREDIGPVQLQKLDDFCFQISAAK